MRDLALHVAASGHDVTYVTMRHWDESERPNLAGVRVLGLTPAGRVYRSERRTLMPPLRFGLAVARHLWRHGSEYDIVHMASFPVLPAARGERDRPQADVRARRELDRGLDEGLLAPLRGNGDRDDRLARAAGVRAHAAHRVLLLAAACAASRRGRVLRDAGAPSRPLRRAGRADAGDGVDPALVVYAGRHVQEKRIDQLVRGVRTRAPRAHPGLRLELYGDGPSGRVRRGAGARRSGSTRRSCLHGRRPEEEVAEAIARAACLVTASEREGYGLVVVEAAAHGTPSVVVAGPGERRDRARRDGVNGVVSPDASPESLAASHIACRRRGHRAAGVDGVVVRRERARRCGSTARSSSSPRATGACSRRLGKLEDEELVVPERSPSRRDLPRHPACSVGSTTT